MHFYLLIYLPLYKLNEPTFREFLEKYTNKNTPDESTIRKNYVCQNYENTDVKIR